MVQSRLTVALTLLVVLAGCTAGIEAPTAADDGGAPTDGETTPALVAGTTEDPLDRIGWEDGYWYNDTIPLNRSDGVSDAELEAYLARAMARVEYLRGHEFTRPIRIDVQTRETLREKVERTGSFASNETLSSEKIRIMNVFWKALFFVGADRDVRAVRASEGASFLGAYYVFGSDRIRIVAPANEPPLVDEDLLVHELVHALQDEYAGTPLETRSDDDNYATAALVEGDAIYVTRQFRDHCRADWDCVDVPPRGGSGGDGDVHAGFRTLRQFAYSEGPAFVHTLFTEGREGTDGWPAVDAAFETRPRTTEEIIHPNRYPMESPDRPGRTVRPREGWRHLGGPYTVGEVEIFGLFWYQAERHGIPVLDPDAYREPDRGEHDRFNYTATPSAGWDGDRLDVFVRGEQSGYVWVSRWDTRRDAVEFATAYRHVLAGNGGVRHANGTWVIPEGPFADAYVIERRGRVVTVVTGPSPTALEAIYPPLDA